MVRAHRFSWELDFGPIPKGKYVLHSCNNPPCVRPDHLYLGTKADNSRFMVECDRQAKGEKHPQAKLTEDEILEIRGISASAVEIALIFSICKRYVYKIKQQERWKHI